jgi:hypothetical protein
MICIAFTLIIDSQRIIEILIYITSAAIGIVGVIQKIQAITAEYFGQEKT